MAMGADVGVRRQLSAVRANLPDKHGINPEDGWSVQIEGALAEQAVAKFLGRYWDGSVDTFRSMPDLGDFEIRRRSKHSYDLIIRKDDDPGKVYILVTGCAPDFWVRGWLRGRDAQCEDWWKDHGNREWAWFVPVSELRTDWPSR